MVTDAGQPHRIKYRSWLDAYNFRLRNSNRPESKSHQELIMEQIENRRQLDIVIT